MNQKELIRQEVDRLPDDCLDELLQFIRRLKTKTSQEVAETTLASERVLAKDWLLDEEEEAWQGL